MKRNFDLRVRLTKEEKESIQKKAQVCGLNPSEYLRLLALKSKIQVD